MASLIPSFGSASARMTGGERRFAQRLGDKLERDCVCWYDVSLGDKTPPPDFIVFHPGHGLLMLEVRDWRLDTILSVEKSSVELINDTGTESVPNPLEQARQCMLLMAQRLECDPQLVWPSGSLKGQPFFPHGYGVVLSAITRRQFESTGLPNILPSHLVICRDEMLEDADSEAFRQRLWNMFPVKFTMKLSPPQIDRVRWHLFPEIRIQPRQGMSEDDAPLPDILGVLDLQQEHLVRSLGDGHRVIHGVAGSGKTLILGYRAEQLARTCRRPILVLCYNRALAARLDEMMQAKGLQGKVDVMSFHGWCVRQLSTYGIAAPPEGSNLDAYFDECVNRVIHAVGRHAIPTGQYDAILVDEGHDFRPEWFRLIVQMVHPDSNSLLVMYDDAQSADGGKEKPPLSFSSVGIEARGRTTVLKVNYRNTVEILSVAMAFAGERLAPVPTEDDLAPTIRPTTAGRHGPQPTLVRLPSVQREADYLATRLHQASESGLAWSDMAVTCRSADIAATLDGVFRMRGIPVQRQGGKKRTFVSQDSVKLITMTSSKGLEFPLVCIPCFGAMPANAGDEQDEANLLYVAMTRATNELIMTYSKPSPLVGQLLLVGKLLKAMAA